MASNDDTIDAMRKRTVSKLNPRLMALVERGLAQRGGKSLEQVEREVSRREQKLKRRPSLQKRKELLALRGRVKWEGDLSKLRRSRARS